MSNYKKHNYKSKKSERETTTYGLSIASKTIKDLTKNVIGKFGFIEADMISNWASIVGQEMADKTYPLKINFSKNKRDNGNLHLAVSSGAYALEIQHREKIILERINSYFGYRAVAKITIMQDIGAMDYKPDEEETPEIDLTEEEKTQITDNTKDIKNEALKNALENLGAKLVKKSKKG